MQLHFQKPDCSLQPFINRYVEFETTGKSEKGVRIYPNGYPYLTYSFHNNADFIKSGVKKTTPTLFLAGLATENNMYLSWESKVGHFGVEFRPTGCHRLLEQNMACLKNETVDFMSLFPRDQKLLQHLQQSQDFVERCAIMDRYFKNIEASPPATHLDAVIEKIYERKGNITVMELSKDFAISKRQLRRIFNKQIGIPPKEFITIVQIKWVYELMGKKDLTVQGLSYEGGYFDPSHFIKTFKKVTGQNPSEFFENYDSFLKFYLAESIPKNQQPIRTKAVSLTDETQRNSLYTHQTANCF